MKCISYCEAALVLKDAFGIKSDLFYSLEFYIQKIKKEDDFSSLANAFNPGERWRLYFNDKPEEFIFREIEILPKADDTLAIVQTVICLWPGCSKQTRVRLAVVSNEEFTNPEKWTTASIFLAKEGQSALKNFSPVLEARWENGSIIRKPVLLNNMIKVCSEIKADKIYNIFNEISECRISPEFPLNEEPRACFKTFICNLSDFTEIFLHRFGISFKYYVHDFISQIWINLFTKKYNINTGFEEFDSESAAFKLREKYPAQTEDFRKEFVLKLAMGSVKIAWGLVTDYTSVRGFVDAVLEHHEIGKKKIPLPVSIYAEKPDESSLRECLNDAIRFFLF